MKYFNVLLIFIAFLLHTGCSDLSSNKLLGQWEAISVIEDGKPMEVDYPTIRLEIMKNGTYQYFGTLNYHEAGTWRITSGHLFTTDTLKPAATEKAVHITFLSKDSFDMTMLDDEKERTMKMVRVVSE